MLTFEKRMVRAPYVVEALEVTFDNIEEINKVVGYTDLQYDDGNGVHYILTNRRIIPNPVRIYPGYFITKVTTSERLQAFTPEIMKEQFFDFGPIVAFEFETEGGVKPLYIHGAFKASMQ